MIDRYLKAKHWQLFLLVVGLPLLFQFVFMASIISTVFTTAETGADPTFDYLFVMPILFVLLLGIFFGWMWSVAVGLGRVIPNELKLKIGRFKLAFGFTIIYMLLFMSFFFYMFFGIVGGGEMPNPSFMIIIFPLQLLAMICNIFCFYFVAKTIKTAEMKKNVVFSDFAGELFMIWFFFVGVWILQPRINRLTEVEATELV